MKVFKILPAEIMGLFVVVSAVLIRIIFPEVSEFWLALATAITLFVLMQIRSLVVVDAPSKEKPSP